MIFQGMAGGTLFYITFFEVLDKDKLNKGGMSGLLGFCFIFAGFAIMAAVNAMGERGQRTVETTDLRSTSFWVNFWQVR